MVRCEGYRDTSLCVNGHTPVDSMSDVKRLSEIGVRILGIVQAEWNHCECISKSGKQNRFSKALNLQTST